MEGGFVNIIIIFVGILFMTVTKKRKSGITVNHKQS